MIVTDIGRGNERTLGGTTPPPLRPHLSNLVLVLFAFALAGCNRCGSCFELEFNSCVVEDSLEGFHCVEDGECLGTDGLPRGLVCVDQTCRDPCYVDDDCFNDRVILGGRCDLVTNTCADPHGPGEFGPLYPPEEEPYDGPSCDLGVGRPCATAADSNETVRCDVEERVCRARCGADQGRPLCSAGYACLDDGDRARCVPGECDEERWWEPCRDSTCAPVWEGRAAFCSPAGSAGEGEFCRDESESPEELCRESLFCISEGCKDPCPLDTSVCGFQDCVAALPLSPAGDFGICATPCNSGGCPGETWCAPIFYRGHSIAWQCVRPIEGPAAREPCEVTDGPFCSTGVLCDAEQSECRELCDGDDICPGARPCNPQPGQVYGLCSR